MKYTKQFSKKYFQLEVCCDTFPNCDHWSISTDKSHGSSYGKNLFERDWGCKFSSWKLAQEDIRDQRWKGSEEKQVCWVWSACTWEHNFSGTLWTNYSIKLCWSTSCSTKWWAKNNSSTKFKGEFLPVSEDWRSEHCS